MAIPPPAAVLEAFGASGVPRPLAGGQQVVWRVGDLVLKRSDTSPSLLQLDADALGAVGPAAGVRVAPPVRATSGALLVGGWTASRVVPGRDARGDWAAVMAAGRALHAALRHVGRPAVLDLRDDVWARADRLVWDLSSAAPHPSLSGPYAARRPVQVVEQLVHGDLTGNVLVDDDGALGVVDFSPYWRPTTWATAVVCVDAVLHSGAELDAVLAAAEAADVVPPAQVLLRAALFRSTTDVLLGRDPDPGARGSRLLDQLVALGGRVGRDLTVGVPDVVRAKAEAAVGGDGWVRGLPGVVDELEQAWGITLTAVLPGGTASFVARAVTQDGRPAVLKVAVPGPESASEVQTLVAADGDGYVQVLRHAPEHGAVLLEALGPSLRESGLAPVDQLATMARLLLRAWQVPPTPASGAPQDKAADLAGLITELWQRLDRPCDRAVVDHALACLARRSACSDPGTAVVVHGDAAVPNAARVLQPRPGAVDGFVLIDPVGFVGDPAYDVGVALRDWCAEVLAADSPVALLRGYCDVLARGSGTDPVAVWEWGFAERVSTGLYALSFGADGTARLRSAEALLELG